MVATMSSTTIAGSSNPRSIDDLRQGPATVIYDGACPFCTAYTKLVQLRESVGTVRLVNARELDPTFLDRLRDSYNVDDGMIFAHEGRIYHGNDAVNRLALLSSDNNVLRRLSSAVLAKPAAAAAIYPFLRFGRNMAIALRGVGRLHR